MIRNIEATEMETLRRAAIKTRLTNEKIMLWITQENKKTGRSERA